MSDDGNPLVDFTHIGVVVHDLDKAIEKYTALGLGPFHKFRLPSDGFAQFKMVEHYGRDASDNIYDIGWGKFGSIAMEIFQPIAGDSIPQRFLDTKGEGVWHYGYDVHSMDETLAWMTSRGYKIVGESETQEGVRMCYFSTDEPGGVLFQAHEVPKTSKMYDKLAGKA